MTASLPVPPAPVLHEMGEYELCLAEAQRLYRQLKNAPRSEREAAQRAYDEALQRAREVAGRLRQRLDADARGVTSSTARSHPPGTPAAAPTG